MRNQSQKKKPKINATMNLEPEEWEGFKEKAHAMGVASRSELIRQIAKGYIQAKEAITTEDKQILGKS